MNTPGTPAGEAPARPAGSSCVPSPPVAGQGNPAGEACENVSPAGPDVPVAAEASSASAAAGNDAPGPGADFPAVSGPGASTGQTLAERQEQQLAAIRAARSAHAKGKRNQRARPWQGRDPYRKAVPGARKLPPGGERG